MTTQQKLKVKQNQIDNRVNKMLTVLIDFYNYCKIPNSYPISDKIRKSGCPWITIAKLKEKNIIINTNGKYKWIGQEPTFDFCDKLYDECLAELNKYNSDKKKEQQIRKAGGNTSSVRYGTKTFVKIIKENKPKEIKKEYPKSITEVKVKTYLDRIRVVLSSASIMTSFSDYCDTRGISEAFENAFIELGIIKKINGKITFCLDTYDVYTIRNIIDVQRKYKNDENLKKPQIIEESTLINIVNTRSGALNRCFSMINDIYSDIKIKKIEIGSLIKYAKKHNTNKSLPYELINNNIILKTNGVFVWTDKQEPTLELAKFIMQTVNKYKSTKHKNTEINEEHINVPTISEVNDIKLTREIALKLIKLGELTEANILLNKLL